MRMKSAIGTNFMFEMTHSLRTQNHRDGNIGKVRRSSLTVPENWTGIRSGNLILTLQLFEKIMYIIMIITTV
jgi:hypothetical protein